jgi:predicted O-methyltransferase YrrM
MARLALSQQSQLIAASFFSLATGLAASAYALWPQESDADLPPNLSACSVATSTASGSVPHGHSRYYEFSLDLFTDAGRLESWQKHLTPYAEKPVNYLEVGVFEGRSMVWMLDNVLRHPSSRATGVDVDIRTRYLQNVKRTGACEKVQSIKARSQDALRLLTKETYDIIYIDGSHVTQDVMIDAVLAFDLLKPGGLMIFDDYAPVLRYWPKDIRPKQAIDAFIHGYRQHLEPVHHGMQLIVRKRAQICDSRTERMSSLGSYCYNWNTGQLLRAVDHSSVELLPQEKTLIEAFSDAPPFEEFTAELRRRPEFQALSTRLRLLEPN